MNVVDKLYTEWAWRSKSGIPNIKNPEDKAILDEILSEFALEDTTILSEGSSDYDTEIRLKLKLKESDPIPLSKGTYKFLGKNGGNFIEDITDADDLKMWKTLWSVKPKTKKGEADNLGVGKGEVSLYWLYNFNEKHRINVEEGRVGDAPDLVFGDGVGVEVKAYDSGTAGISLGRFSQDKENLQMLSVAFGLNTLTSILDPNTDKKVLNPTNFNGTELPPVFEAVTRFATLDNLEGLASQYSIFKTIKDNTDFLIERLGGAKSVEEAARNMAYRILNQKLQRKPGDGNYLTNVSNAGKMHWWNIDLNKIKNSDKLLTSFGVNQSKIKLTFSKVLS